MRLYRVLIKFALTFFICGKRNDNNDCFVVKEAKEAKERKNESEKRKARKARKETTRTKNSRVYFRGTFRFPKKYLTKQFSFFRSFSLRKNIWKKKGNALNGMEGKRGIERHLLECVCHTRRHQGACADMTSVSLSMKQSFVFFCGNISWDD